MIAEFEEKQFEQALNFELISNNRFFYIPGQCLENTLGFDAGIFTTNIDFWNLFPNYKFFRYYHKYFYLYPEGIELRKEMWGILEKEIDNPYFFPKIKFNLFIQYKRPEYLSRKNSSEWHLWMKPYFRYELTEHQQVALEKLDNQIHNNAIVVYASPAFYKLKDLWVAKNNNSLVRETNFVQASKLTYHSKFTYAEAGKFGIGFSEPEKIESFNFKEKISELFESKSNVSNSIILKKLSTNIDEIMLKHKIYSKIYKSMVEKQKNEYNKNKLQRIFRKINAFLFLTNTTMISGFSDR